MKELVILIEKQAERQIAFGGILSYLLIILNIFLGLIYIPWIVNTIGNSSYGLYTLATSLIALFLYDLGMSSAVTRFIANYRVENKVRCINEIVCIALKVYAGIILIIAVILGITFFYLDDIYINLTSNEISTLKIVFLIASIFVVLSFPVNVFNGILSAYEKYVAIKCADLLNRVLTTMFTIVALYNGGGVITLVFINGFFNFITLIVKVIATRVLTPVKFFNYNSEKSIKYRDVFSFTSWITINSLAQQMVFNFIPSILAITLNTFSITLFSFARVIEGHVYTISDAINGLFLPSVSRIVVGSNNDAKGVLPLMIKIGRLNLSIMGLLLLGFTVLGREFVSLWLGDMYYDVYYCALVICWPYILFSTQQIAFNSLIVLNKIKYVAICNLFLGIFNLLLAFYMSSLYGVLGVSISIGMVFLVRLIVNNYIYNRILKINIKEFFIKTYKRFSLCCVLTIFLYFSIIQIFDEIKIIAIFHFVIKCITLSIVYILLIWVVYLKTGEKEAVKKIFFKNNNRII